MWKKILLGALGISLLLEIVMTAGGFLAPEQMLTQFQLPVIPETLFLGYVVAWMMLLVSVVCGLAFIQVKNDNPNGWTLTYVLGIWWVGIGLGLFLKYGKIDNLFLDTLKGALLVLAAKMSCKTCEEKSEWPLTKN